MIFEDGGRVFPAPRVGGGHGSEVKIKATVGRVERLGPGPEVLVDAPDVDGCFIVRVVYALEGDDAAGMGVLGPKREICAPI